MSGQTVVYIDEYESSSARATIGHAGDRQIYRTSAQNDKIRIGALEIPPATIVVVAAVGVGLLILLLTR